MKLIPLGTNGFYPSHGRHTSCYLLLPGDPAKDAVIIDAGTGFSRLAGPEVQALLPGEGTLHIVLSHYHLDHTAGLFYLTGVWPGRRAVLYAPTRPLVDAGALAAVERLLGPPLYPMRLADVPLEIVPVAGAETTIAGVPARFRPQKHPGGSAGIRFGDALAYITDTVADPETAAFVRGCRLVLHEVWLNDEEAGTAVEPDGVPAREKHSWLGAVAGIAARSGAGAFAPVHFPPWRTGAEIEAIARHLEELSGVPALALKEGAVYDLLNLPLAQSSPHAAARNASPMIAASTSPKPNN